MREVRLSHSFVAPIRGEISSQDFGSGIRASTSSQDFGLKRALLVRGLDAIRRPQFCDQAVQAVGKIIDVEVEWIIVTVGNLGINCGMIRRNEPSFGSNAGDHV